MNYLRSHLIIYITISYDIDSITNDACDYPANGLSFREYDCISANDVKLADLQS